MHQTPNSKYSYHSLHWNSITVYHLEMQSGVYFLFPPSKWGKFTSTGEAWDKVARVLTSSNLGVV